MMQSLRREVPADYVACVFDASGPTFRDAIYPDYKAQRAPMPDDLRAQIAPIHDVVRLLGWPVLNIPGVEADDVIGTLAVTAARQGIEVIVSSGDKDLAQLVNEHITIIDTMNGKRRDLAGVEAEFGVPARLMIDFQTLVGDAVDNVPGVQGVSWVKYLRRIEVGDQPWAAKDEAVHYIDLMPDGTHRQYTGIQECKSVITTPSAGQTLLDKGYYNVTGLAWSGRGAIKRVDVSVDGGRNWRTARLEGPVLPKALTRFNIDWVWDDKPAILQSRAIDSTGYVQPKMNQLRAVRGTRSVYHQNAIHSWKVAENGEVSNVQVY